MKIGQSQSKRDQNSKMLERFNFLPVGKKGYNCRMAEISSVREFYTNFLKGWRNSKIFQTGKDGNWSTMVKVVPFES